MAVTRLADAGASIKAALDNATAALAEQLLALAQTLAPRRTGQLADSLAIDQTETGASVGSDLPYAAYQAYGFSGIEQVAAHLRRQSVVFGMPMTPRDVLVQSYDRRVDFAGEDFLGEALDQMRDDIAAAYRDAAVGALGS